MEDVRRGTGSVNVLANDLPGDASDPILSELIVLAGCRRPRRKRIRGHGAHRCGSSTGVHPRPDSTAKATFSTRSGRPPVARQAGLGQRDRQRPRQTRPARAAIGWRPGERRCPCHVRPDPDNGSPITAYTVTPGRVDRRCGAVAGQCVVDGLTNGTEYTFRVTATNAVGTSDPHPEPSQPYTPVGADQPPRRTWTGMTDRRRSRGRGSPTGSPLTAVRIDSRRPTWRLDWTGRRQRVAPLHRGVSRTQYTFRGHGGEQRRPTASRRRVRRRHRDAGWTSATSPPRRWPKATGR